MTQKVIPRNDMELVVPPNFPPAPEDPGIPTSWEIADYGPNMKKKHLRDTWENAIIAYGLRQSEGDKKGMQNVLDSLIKILKDNGLPTTPVGSIWNSAPANSEQTGKNRSARAINAGILPRSKTPPPSRDGTIGGNPPRISTSRPAGGVFPPLQPKPSVGGVPVISENPRNLDSNSPLRHPAVIPGAPPLPSKPSPALPRQFTTNNCHVRPVGVETQTEKESSPVYVDIHIMQARGLQGDAAKTNPTAFIFRKNVMDNSETLVFRTKKISKTLSPTWNERFKVNVNDPETEVLGVRVCSGKKFNPFGKKFLGEISFPLRNSKRNFNFPNFKVGWYPFSSGNSGSDCTGECKICIEFYDTRPTEKPKNFHREGFVEKTSQGYNFKNIPNEWEEIFTQYGIRTRDLEADSDFSTQVIEMMTQSQDNQFPEIQRIKELEGVLFGFCKCVEAAEWWKKNFDMVATVPCKRFEKAIKSEFQGDLNALEHVLTELWKTLDTNIDSQVSIIEYSNLCANGTILEYVKRKVAIYLAKESDKKNNISRIVNNSTFNQPTKTFDPKDFVKGSQGVFLPDIKKALIITNSNYRETSGLDDLHSANFDGKAIRELLHETLCFSPDDITHLHNPWEENIVDALKNIDNLPRDSKRLIFVYYSGHGAIQHFTGICTIENTFYPIEDKLRKMASRPHTYFIVLLDCCREVQFKSGHSEKPHVTIGQTSSQQMYFLYAASPGKTAIGFKDSISPVTESFIKLLKTTNTTWPGCLDSWTGRKAELTSVLSEKLILYLTPNMVVDEVKSTASQNPTQINACSNETPQNIIPASPEVSPSKKIKMWEPREVAEWLSTIRLTKNYTQDIIRKKVDGDALLIIHKTGEWKRFGFDEDVDVFKIENALLEVIPKE